MAKIYFPHLPKSQNEIPDWEYNMRRDMQEIIPNVFLGPYSVAVRSKLQFLYGHGITHIICIRHPIEANRIKPNFPEHFRYMVLDVVDSPTEPIMKHFPMVKMFIADALTAGGKVLLHGNCGLSRSAALMIAYVMETYGLTYEKAFVLVQEKRYCINPNEGFVRQLLEYEPVYLARSQQQHQSEPGNWSLKRSYESDDDDVSMVMANPKREK